MFLTAYNLPHYLLTRGLIDAESIVDGDCSVVEAGRRNRNFKVLRRRSPGLFVKQIKTTEAQAISTVDREAAFYKAIQNNSLYAALARLMPRLVDYDANRHALILTLTEEAESIGERHVRERRYEPELARILGAALGLVHWHGMTIVADPATRFLFPYQVPWPLNIGQTGLSMLAGVGPIGPALAAGIGQHSSLLSRVAALRSEWVSDSLIHNDMKWDNCLVKLFPAQEAQMHPQLTPELTIVDWELADIGDAAWDIAGIFKEYIMAVLLSSQLRQLAEAQQQPLLSPVTFEVLYPSIQAFWDGYSGMRGLSLHQVQKMLLRAIRFTAGRMMLGVLEYLGSQTELGTLGNLMLQTSVGLLEAPHVAITQLFGQQSFAG